MVDSSGACRGIALLGKMTGAPILLHIFYGAEALRGIYISNTLAKSVALCRSRISMYDRPSDTSTQVDVSYWHHAVFVN